MESFMTKLKCMLVPKIHDVISLHQGLFSINKYTLIFSHLYKLCKNTLPTLKIMI